VILNRDHGGLSAQRAVITFEENAIGKFQRMIDNKKDFARRAKLDDSVLKEDIFVFGQVGASIAIAATIAIAAIAISVRVAIGMRPAKPDRDPHRRGLGKEFRQAANDV
jgi:hypothetical protein